LPLPLVEAPEIETVETVAPVADTQLAAIDMAPPAEIVPEAAVAMQPRPLQPEIPDLQGQAIDEVVAPLASLEATRAEGAAVTLPTQDEVRQPEAPKAKVAADEQVAPLTSAEALRVEGEAVAPTMPDQARQAEATM